MIHRCLTSPTCQRFIKAEEQFFTCPLVNILPVPQNPESFTVQRERYSYLANPLGIFLTDNERVQRIEMIAKGSFRIREIDDLVVEGSVQFRVAGEKKSIENCRARKKIRITDTMLRVAKVNSFQLTSTPVSGPSPSRVVALPILRCANLRPRSPTYALP